MSINTVRGRRDGPPRSSFAVDQILLHMRDASSSPTSAPAASCLEPPAAERLFGYTMGQADRPAHDMLMPAPVRAGPP